MQTRTLGKNGPSVAALGLGCMGMSDFYGPADRAESIATIHAALDAGISLLDTGDYYAMGHNEMLIGEALKGRDRSRVQISVKYGGMRDPGGTGSATMPAPRRPATFSPTRSAASAPTTSTSTGPAGSIARCRSRRRSAPSPTSSRPATSAMPASRRWARPRSAAPTPSIRSPISRSNIRSSRAASRTRSCRPAASSASASPPMASSPAD